MRITSVFHQEDGEWKVVQARVILMDVADTTLAIEMYGDDQEAWLPLAQTIVDTIHFME